MIYPPANHPVSGFPLSGRLSVFPTAYRLPPTAYPYFTLIDFTNVSCGACLLVFQPPGSAV